MPVLHNITLNKGNSVALIQCKECGNKVSTDASACPKCGANMRKTRPAFKVIGAFLCVLFLITLLFDLFEDKEQAAVEGSDQAVSAAPAVSVENSFENEVQALLRSNESMLEVTKKGGKYGVRIKYAPDQIWDYSSLITNVSHRLVDIGKEAQEKGLPLGSLAIDAWVPVSDKYGNKSKSEAITISISDEDVEKINWENINAWGLLNLSTFGYKTKHGEYAHNEYCLGADAKKYAHIFCTGGKPSAKDIKAYDMAVKTLNDTSAKEAYQAEVEINQVWKQLSKEKRQELLSEQREFNRMKEEKCLKPYLAQGGGEEFEMAKNMCLYETYKERTQELKKILEHEQQ